MTKMINLRNMDNGGGLFLLNAVTQNASAESSPEIPGLIQRSWRQSYAQGVFLKNPILLNLQKPMCEGHVQLSSLLKILVVMKRLLVVLQSLVPEFEYTYSSI